MSQKDTPSVKDWPKVVWPRNDEKPTCTKCHSTDIRHHPTRRDHWGCAGCGVKSRNVSNCFPVLPIGSNAGSEHRAGDLPPYNPVGGD